MRPRLRAPTLWRCPPAVPWDRRSPRHVGMCSDRRGCPVGGDTWSLLVWTTSNVTGVKGDGLGHEFETRGKEGGKYVGGDGWKAQRPCRGAAGGPSLPMQTHLLPVCCFSPALFHEVLKPTLTPIKQCARRPDAAGDDFSAIAFLFVGSIPNGGSECGHRHRRAPTFGRAQPAGTHLGVAQQNAAHGNMQTAGTEPPEKLNL